MNNNRKLLFFDIDGTLLTAYPWSIPESTRKALEAARKNGHLLFVNSGRTYAMISLWSKNSVLTDMYADVEARFT